MTKTLAPGVIAVYQDGRWVILHSKRESVRELTARAGVETTQTEDESGLITLVLTKPEAHGLEA